MKPSKPDCSFGDTLPGTAYPSKAHTTRTHTLNRGTLSTHVPLEPPEITAKLIQTIFTFTAVYEHLASAVTSGTDFSAPVPSFTSDSDTPDAKPLQKESLDDTERNKAHIQHCGVHLSETAL